MPFPMVLLVTYLFSEIRFITTIIWGAKDEKVQGQLRSVMMAYPCNIPVITALGKVKQEDYKLEASMVYIVSISNR